MSIETPLPPCACGCGQSVRKHGNRFLRGHVLRSEEGRRKFAETNARPLPLCVCGCGNPVHSHQARHALLPGHHVALPLCACGCGREVTKPANRFLCGHHRPPPRAEPILIEGMPLCGCGCGFSVKSLNARFLSGHHTRLLTPEEQSQRANQRSWTPEKRTAVGAKLAKVIKQRAAERRAALGPLPLCECGCGATVTRHDARFIKGHSSRTEEHKARSRQTSQARKGVKHTPEARARISEKKQAFFANGGEPWNKNLTKELHPSIALHSKNGFTTETHYRLSFPTASTCPEAIVQLALVQRGIPFLFNVPVRGICRPDFALPFAKIIIQVDGAYWHRDRKDKDAEQDKALTDLGWLVFRWEEEEIRQHLDALLDTVEAAYTSRLNCQGSGTPDESGV